MFVMFLIGPLLTVLGGLIHALVVIILDTFLK